MEPSCCTSVASKRHRKQLQTPGLVAEGADTPEQEIPLPKAGSLLLKIRTRCKESELPPYGTICLTVAEVVDLYATHHLGGILMGGEEISASRLRMHCTAAADMLCAIMAYPNMLGSCILVLIAG